MILESKLNGIFQPLHMERGHVMVLQRPYIDQLMTPRLLFNWVCSNIPAAYFGYCSNEDYAREQSSLERRFQLSRTIPGTRKLHFLCRSQIAQWKSSFTHHLMFPGKREQLY